MLKTLLVPLDGSAESEQALISAGTLARRSGAALRLVHVHVPILDVYMGSWNMGGIPIVDEALDVEQRASEQAHLEAVRDRLIAEGYTVSCTLLDGTVAVALADYAAASQPDLVVMTTHGRGALSRLWLGSVADRFIRSCCVPTLLVRPQAAGRIAAQKPDGASHRMLIPLDGSALAEQIVKPACAVGELLAAEYYLVQVVEPLNSSPWRMAGTPAAGEYAHTQPQRHAAQAYLHGIASTLRDAGHQVQVHVDVATQPARAILEMADSYAVDIIALATHGHGGLQRLLVGSVADKVVRSTELPVLVLHPQPAPDAADYSRE